MKKKWILGTVAGFAVGTAAGIAGKLVTEKVIGEIKGSICEQDFVSPEEKHTVKISYGYSKAARELTYIRVEATSAAVDDTCRMVLFTKKPPEMLDAQWTDSDHFKFLVGSGKRKQCCDVTFDGNNINATYYLTKDC